MSTRMTQQEFADRIGLSYRTVSRVFNDHPHVSDRARERVLCEARRLGFRHHPGARGLRMKKTFTVGMILQNEPLYFWSRILARLERDLRAAQYYLMVCHRREEDAGSGDELSYLLDRDVDAVILVPSPGEKPGRIRAFLEQGKPLLLLDQRVPGVGCHYLGTDSRAGSKALCRRLIALGHRRIAFVTGPPTQYTSRRREEGYRAALAAAEISGSASHVFHARAWDRVEGERAADHFMGVAERPTAIMAANDVIAMGLHLRLRQLGLRLPRDMSLAGYGGELDGELVTPSLTTVAQPAEELGSHAAALVLELIRRPPARPIREVLDDRLIIRESVARPGG